MDGRFYLPKGATWTKVKKIGPELIRFQPHGARNTQAYDPERHILMTVIVFPMPSVMWTDPDGDDWYFTPDAEFIRNLQDRETPMIPDDKYLRKRSMPRPEPYTRGELYQSSGKPTLQAVYRYFERR